MTMIRSARLLTAAALLLMGVASLWLNHLRTVVHLGKPGVKLSSLPVFDNEGQVARTNSIALPTLVRGYRARVEPITRIELGVLPPDTTYARRTYATEDRSFQAQASAVLMGTDRTSIHRPEYCLVGQGWNLLRKRSTTIPITRPNPYHLPVQRFDMQFQATVKNQSVLRGGVYVFWFVADGQLTESHVRRQWWMMRELVLHQTLQRWSYISFFSDCAPGGEDATFEKMARLIAATVPEFQLTTGHGL